MSTDIYFLYLYLHSAITMQCLYNIIISIKTIQYLLDIIIMIHDIIYFFSDVPIDVIRSFLCF